MRTLRHALATLCLTAPALLAQIPCFDTNLGTNLALGDESFSSVLPLGFTFSFAGTPYTDVQVCSNGYVVFGSGAPLGVDYTPTAFELVTNTIARVCPMWMDFDPSAAGSGGIYSRAVAATANHPAYFSVTWDGVYRYNRTVPQTMQLRLVDGGAIELYLGANFASNVDYWLCGASPGNGALTNPVSFAALPFATAGNATLHQNGAASIPFADTVQRWTPDALGGYVVNAAPACAIQARYGTGCVRAYTSFYEHFPSCSQFDLSNTSLTGLMSGTGYLIVPGLTTFVAPSGSAVNLGLANDAQTTVTLSAPLLYPGGSVTTVSVCSNGFISTGPNGASYQPGPAAFLNRIYASWSVWHDWITDPTNNVMFEEAGGIAYFTWSNVLSYIGLTIGTTPSTFQFQFHLATGNWHLVFQNIDTTSVSGYQGGDGYLVGYSPAGASADPGSLDLSAALPATLQLAGADISPLRLAAGSRPVLGTSVNLTVSDIPAGSPFGAVQFGLVGFDPGQSLTSIGMPGCFQYQNGMASALFFSPSTTATVPFASPAAAAFLGTTVFCQGAAYSPPLTPLGAIASNGVRLQLGN